MAKGKGAYHSDAEDDEVDDELEGESEEDEEEEDDDDTSDSDAEERGGGGEEEEDDKDEDDEEDEEDADDDDASDDHEDDVPTAVTPAAARPASASGAAAALASAALPPKKKRGRSTGGGDGAAVASTKPPKKRKVDFAAAPVGGGGGDAAAATGAGGEAAPKKKPGRQMIKAHLDSNQDTLPASVRVKLLATNLKLCKSQGLEGDTVTVASPQIKGVFQFAPSAASKEGRALTAVERKVTVADIEANNTRRENGILSPDIISSGVAARADGTPFLAADNAPLRIKWIHMFYTSIADTQTELQGQVRGSAPLKPRRGCAPNPPPA